MGKTSNCIKLLQLLNTGRMYKVSELASYLETNPRNIYEYRKELEECGYYITSITGRYGGFKLDKSSTIPSLKLTENEKDALIDNYNYSLAKKSFINKSEYEKAMSKIMSSFENNISGNDYFETISYTNNDISDEYKKIKEATKKRNTCEITYINKKNKSAKDLINPYELYLYNDEWFVLAYSLNKKDFTYFKLKRMKDVAVLSKRFTRDVYYKKRDYFDEEGYLKTDEWYDVEFKIRGYYLNKIIDKKIGKNQIVEMIDDNSATVKVSMQYKTNIINFIMGLGANCEVIKPEWLKKQILNTVMEMMNIYNK